MGTQRFYEIDGGIAEIGVFAFLAIQTREGRTVFRPIGGDWGADITIAIKEAAQEYPECKMRLYEHNYDSWRRYFEGVIPEEQLID